MRDENDVPQPSYGEMREKISIEDIHDKPCPATIATVDMRDMSRSSDRKADNKIILTFREFPKREYIANSTSYKTLCDKLGADWRRWTGKVIVLAPTINSFDGKAFEKVHVATPDRWDKVLKAVEAASKARK